METKDLNALLSNAHNNNEIRIGDTVVIGSGINAETAIVDSVVTTNHAQEQEHIYKPNRAARRAHEKAEKKRMKEEAVSRKTWSKLQTIFREFGEQIVDIDVNIVEMLNDSSLDVVLEEKDLAELRKIGSSIKLDNGNVAVKLNEIQARHDGLKGEARGEDADLWDEINVDYMELQLQYTQSVIPKAADLAMRCSEELSKANDKEEAIKASKEITEVSQDNQTTQPVDTKE